MAHRGIGDPQLLRCRRKAAVAGRRFEGAQCVEGRETPRPWLRISYPWPADLFVGGSCAALDNASPPSDADALAMITLYDYLDSGNGYKIRLAAGAARPTLPLDRARHSRPTRRVRPSFWRKIRTAASRCWSWMTGRAWRNRTPLSGIWPRAVRFVPDNRLQRAQVLQWMFFEQYSHEPYVATPRFIVKHLPADSPRRAELPDRMVRGRRGAGGHGDPSLAALVFCGGHLQPCRHCFVCLHACRTRSATSI